MDVHWCTEGVFQALRGVAEVDQVCPIGRSGRYLVRGGDRDLRSIGYPIGNAFRGASQNTFRYQGRSPRGKYRSAIYIFEDSQLHDAELAIVP